MNLTLLLQEGSVCCQIMMFDRIESSTKLLPDTFCICRLTNPYGSSCIITKDLHTQKVVAKTYIGSRCLCKLSMSITWPLLSHDITVVYFFMVSCSFRISPFIFFSLSTCSWSSILFFLHAPLELLPRIH